MLFQSFMKVGNLVFCPANLDLFLEIPFFVTRLLSIVQPCAASIIEKVRSRSKTIQRQHHTAFCSVRKEKRRPAFGIIWLTNDI